VIGTGYQVEKDIVPRLPNEMVLQSADGMITESRD
jgi:hypothetical protein